MQLFIILLLVLFNGVLAMSEIAVVSARRGQLREKAEAGSRGAQMALGLAENPNRFLSTVQIGITLVGVVAGAFGGTTVGRQLGEWLAEVAPITAAYSEPLGIGLIVLFTTYLSLVLGELVPKRLAMQFPDAISSRIAVPMSRLSALAAPLVWLLSFSSDTVLRLMGIDPNAEPSLSDAEVVNMVKEGAHEGVFEPHEADMVRGVLELDDLRVADIMTPRPDIRALSIHDPLDEIKRQIISSPHSFYPVADGDIDNTVGVIKAKDLLTPIVKGEEVDMNRLMRAPLFIPEVTVAARALEIFRGSGTHVALVVGEHGGTVGLLTLNDVIEEIVGDVDADEPEIVQRENGSWLVDGRTSLTRLDSALPDAMSLPEGEPGNYRTLAGFIMARLDRMPEIGDHFTYAGLRFEVVDMDSTRVDRVRVEEVKVVEEADEDDTETAPSEDSEDTVETEA